MDSIAASVRHVDELGIDVFVVGGPADLGQGQRAYVGVPIRPEAMRRFRPTPEDIRVHPVGKSGLWYATLWEFGPILEQDLSKAGTPLPLTEQQALIEAYNAYVKGEPLGVKASTGKSVPWWRKANVAAFRNDVRATWNPIRSRVRQAVHGQLPRSSQTNCIRSVQLRLGTRSKAYDIREYAASFEHLVALAKMYQPTLVGEWSHWAGHGKAVWALRAASPSTTPLLFYKSDRAALIGNAPPPEMQAIRSDRITIPLHVESDQYLADDRCALVGT